LAVALYTVCGTATLGNDWTTEVSFFSAGNQITTTRMQDWERLGRRSLLYRAFHNVLRDYRHL